MSHGSLLATNDYRLGQSAKVIEHSPLIPSRSPPSGDAFPLGPELVPKPFVVATMGLPGAGKSVVAKAIEDQLGLRRICRDQIRAAMFPQCRYTYLEKRAAFRSVLLALEINCMLGVGSVIDGMTFSRRSELDRVARSRVARDLAENRHVAADRTPETVNDVIARRQPAPEGTLIIDATLSEAAMCSAAIAAIRESIAAAVAAGA